MTWMGHIVTGGLNILLKSLKNVRSVLWTSTQVTSYMDTRYVYVSVVVATWCCDCRPRNSRRVKDCYIVGQYFYILVVPFLMYTF